MFYSDGCAQRHVSEARQPAPQDSISGQWIAGERKITAEPSDLGQVVGYPTLRRGIDRVVRSLDKHCDMSVKQRILDYNEDDCVATRVLLDGIRAL